MRIKAPLYARHGVAELWVLDLPGALLHRFSAPQGDAYSDIIAIERPAAIDLPGPPGCRLDLSGVF